MSTLGEVLDLLSDPVPAVNSLPPTHLTDAREFNGIAKLGHLPIKHCRIQKEDLLYLFYGGVFYRRSYRPTANAGRLPIAFLLSPIVLNSMHCYYPFDTGGVATGRYGTSGDRLRTFEDLYRVWGKNYTIPAKMVYYLYGSNDAYLWGSPNVDLKTRPEPCPTLFDFLSAELTRIGIDQRWRRIEARSKSAISTRDLLWVGFPSGFESEFGQLYESLKPFVPEYYRYPAHPARRPGEMAALLETKAHEIIQRFMHLPIR